MMQIRWLTRQHLVVAPARMTDSERLTFEAGHAAVTHKTTSLHDQRWRLAADVRALGHRTTNTGAPGLSSCELVLCAATRGATARARCPIAYSCISLRPSDILVIFSLAVPSPSKGTPLHKARGDGQGGKMVDLAPIPIR